MKQKDVDVPTPITREVMRMEEYFSECSCSYYEALNFLLATSNAQNILVEDQCKEEIQSAMLAQVHLNEQSPPHESRAYTSTLYKWINNDFVIPYSFLRKAFDVYTNHTGRADNVEAFVNFLLLKKLFRVVFVDEKLEYYYTQSIANGNAFLFRLVLELNTQSPDEIKFKVRGLDDTHFYQIIENNYLDLFCVLESVCNTKIDVQKIKDEHTTRRQYSTESLHTWNLRSFNSDDHYHRLLYNLRGVKRARDDQYFNILRNNKHTF